MKIWFITYSGLPDLDPDDRLSADILRIRGHEVIPKVWDDTSVNWDSPDCDLAVVRSTWDYHKKYESFQKWLERPQLRDRLLNPADLMVWNSNKKYLRDLEKQGVKIVPTIWADRGSNPDELSSRVKWDRAIIKPTVGLATSDVNRFDPANPVVRDLMQRADCMVQPFMDAVETSGERSLVFIDGRYSHAIRKSPFQVLAAAGHAGERSIEPDADELAFAHTVISKVKSAPPPLYARVDIVRNTYDPQTPPCLMELELVEPSLFVDLDPRNAAALRFADAIEKRLDRE